ncbi:ferredoxin [Nocardia camponoti]|uniref:Ferredoxin n=1 Tax=Nocardia camponoti TaxID=1616106 RepID=A0A917V3G7_9NOCA|nr:ferredoxin [Nocardia camponoti]GGK34465.1 hypothetical protein GCM10011591_02680 [Nocardia camponoti]
MYWDPTRFVWEESAGTPLIGSERTVLAEPATYLRGEWANRDWRNVPGPFYGAFTDSCWVGRLVAPDHIVYENDRGSEVVFRQPRNPIETRRVLAAAVNDPYQCYACDGDSHWTVSLIREWWADRSRVAEWIEEQYAAWSVLPRDQERDAAFGLRAYGGYLSGGLEAALREYAFWVDNGRAADPGELLPTIV